jgi:hypothetical protein
MAEQKTLTELKSINDKNLLAYYKAERERTLMLLHNTDPKMYTEKQQDAKDYLTIVKRELDTRGHVEAK